MSNDALGMAVGGVGLFMMVCAMGICRELQKLQRILAKLPAYLNERKEIVLPPREEARQGDVIFHIPSSLYGDRS